MLQIHNQPRNFTAKNNYTYNSLTEMKPNSTWIKNYSKEKNRPCIIYDEDFDYFQTIESLDLISAKKKKHVTFVLNEFNIEEQSEEVSIECESVILVPIMPKNLNNLKFIDAKFKLAKTDHPKCINVLKCQNSLITSNFTHGKNNSSNSLNYDELITIIPKYRHLIFSPQISQEILMNHILQIIQSLFYIIRFLKGPSSRFLASKQITLKNEANGIKLTFGDQINLIIDMVASGKTLVLDLDETLVKVFKVNKTTDFQIAFDNGDNSQMVNLKLRPFAQDFINNMSKIFEIIIFSSFSSEFTKQICKILDPDGTKISNILDISHCLLSKNGLAIKDLRIMKNRELKNIIIVDNLSHSFCFQPFNGIPILEWSGNPNDEELKYLERYLIKLSNVKDVQEFNKENLRLNQLLDLKLC